MGEAAAAADGMGAHSRIKETGGGETFPLSTPHAMSHVWKGKKCKWAVRQKTIRTIRLFLLAYVQKGAKYPYYTTTSTPFPSFRKCRFSSTRVLNLGGLPFPHLINMGHPKAPFLSSLSLSPREGRRREICSGDGHGLTQQERRIPPPPPPPPLIMCSCHLAKKRRGNPKTQPFLFQDSMRSIRPFCGGGQKPTPPPTFRTSRNFPFSISPPVEKKGKKRVFFGLGGEKSRRRRKLTRLREMEEKKKWKSGKHTCYVFSFSVPCRVTKWEGK